MTIVALRSSSVRHWFSRRSFCISPSCGQVRLYRADDSGSLSFSLLASAVDVSVAPRRLRLESQGTNHRVYFNGVLLINYTDSSNVYTAGQPGIAVSTFGMILSFSGGAL
jgi:hypothetical protein